MRSKVNVLWGCEGYDVGHATARVDVKGKLGDGLMHSTVSPGKVREKKQKIYDTSDCRLVITAGLFRHISSLRLLFLSVTSGRSCMKLFFFAVAVGYINGLVVRKSALLFPKRWVVVPVQSSQSRK